MKVCVIGAGPSGLTTIKQLVDENQDVTCFESNESIGGIWYRGKDNREKMKAYDNLMLTISMKLMSFSDFMFKDGRKFTDHKGYLQYLESYAQYYNLRQHIQFNTEVKEVVYEGEKQWRITTVNANGDKMDHMFEAVAVCSGPFKKPNTEIKELKGFTGDIIHSSRYRNNEEYTNKRVLAVGLAESGADILREISNVSKDCVVTVRSHTFLIPRLIYGKYSTDSLTTRSHHYEMWNRASSIQFVMKSYSQDNWLLKRLFLLIAALYGLLSIPINFIGSLIKKASPEEILSPVNSMGQLKLPSKLDFDTHNHPDVIKFINEWNHKSHNNKGNWSQKIIFSKNVSFVPNILNKKLAVEESGIERAEGNTVYFKNGEAKQFDCVILCTGFKKDFSFIKGVSIPDNNVRHLYKHTFTAAHKGLFAMIGFIRPISGGIPICAEMQARYFALLCSGKLELPKDVETRISKEMKWEEEWMCLSPRHTESIPSQIMFLDSIAKEIGCHYPFYKLIFRPKLFVKLWFYSFNQSCYRLIGPHSNYNEAVQDILKEQVPLRDYLFMLTMILLSFLPGSIHPKNLDFKYGNAV